MTGSVLTLRVTLGAAVDILAVSSLRSVNTGHLLCPPEACVSVSGAVVIAFVVCWLPYHVRRLMFCYISDEQWTP